MPNLSGYLDEDKLRSCTNNLFEEIPMPEPEKNQYETAPCAHCGGIGCCYCDKTGCVLVAAPKRICPHCEGIGCIYCGFTGWAGVKGKYD